MPVRRGRHGDPAVAAGHGRRGLARFRRGGRSPARSTDSGCAGPIDPAPGARCNPAKLLLDPYARAISGAGDFGPAVYGHDLDNPCAAKRSGLRRGDAAQRDGGAAAAGRPGFRGPLAGRSSRPGRHLADTRALRDPRQGLHPAAPGYPGRDPRHLRRTGAPGGHRAPAAARVSPRWNCCRCTTACRRHFWSSAG